MHRYYKLNYNKSAIYYRIRYILLIFCKNFYFDELNKYLPFFSECMGVREVKPIFHKNDESIGARDCMVLPTSGLTGDGVEEGIKWLVDCVKRNTPIRPPRGNEDN